MEKCKMAVSALQAAKYLCEESGWTLTNLKLQKILYLAHLVYMGRNNGQCLIRESFEAWDYGPVIPELYHVVKIFGSREIKNVFRGYADIPDGRPEKIILFEALDKLSIVSSGRLVDATHRSYGAWKATYRPGEKGIPISDRAILNEYNNLVRA
jgi:uncharacterized phage-associated protein